MANESSKDYEKLLKNYYKFYKLDSWMSDLLAMFMISVVGITIVSGSIPPSHINLLNIIAFVLLGIPIVAFGLLLLQRLYYKISANTQVAISLYEIQKIKTQSKNDYLIYEEEKSVKRFFGNLREALLRFKKSRRFIPTQKKLLLDFIREIKYLREFTIMENKDTFLKMNDDLGNIAKSFESDSMPSFCILYTKLQSRLAELAAYNKIKKRTNVKESLHKIWAYITKEETVNKFRNFWQISKIFILIIIFILASILFISQLISGQIDIAQLISFLLP